MFSRFFLFFFNLRSKATNFLCENVPRMQNRIFLQSTNKNSSTLTALADPVKVIKIAADVIPKPATTSVQHDAVLLAIVIVRLFLAPRWLLHDFACKRVVTYLISIF